MICETSDRDDHGSEEDEDIVEETKVLEQSYSNKIQYLD